MKCPFIPGECIGRECPGWCLGRCFIEMFLQKMDNISLKLDTLCNLTSITAVSHASVAKPAETGLIKPEGSDRERETNEAGKQAYLWDRPVVTTQTERVDAHGPVDANAHQPHEILPCPDKWPEASSLDSARDPDAEALRREGMSDSLNSGNLREVHHPAAEDRMIIPDRALLTGFPAKVSDITFADETEAHANDTSASAQSVEELPELILEAPTVQELAFEATDDLAVDERMLLTAEPTNGSGTTGITYDAMTPESYPESPSDGSKETLSQPTEDPTLEEVVTPDPEPVVSVEEPLMVTASAETAAEALSVERVITDITSAEEHPETEAESAGSQQQIPTAAPTVKSVEEPMAQDEAITEKTAAVQTVETMAEPSSAEGRAPFSEEPGAVTLEAARTGQAEAPEPVAEYSEEPPGDGLAPTGDMTDLDPLADAGGIEVSVEEIQEPLEEAVHSADPSSWVPVGLVEAKGEAVLAMDFGAALSKVALKPDEATPAIAVPLALTAYDILHRAGLMSHFESRNEYAEDSVIYFDQNEFVFCGSLAKKLALQAAEGGQVRPAIQNLKTFLVRGGANLQIHSDFFPSSESLDSQSVLAIYLAYLLRLTRHYLDKRAAKIPVDLDTTIRNFSIPTWIEDRYREDVKRLFRGAAAYAFCLERWLKDDLVRGARLPDVRKALEEAREHKDNIREKLVGSIMTEGAAAGHTRLIGLAHDRARPLTVLTVDVGAGFTDFAIFSVLHSEGNNITPTAQLVRRGGVGTGLGVWDNALKTLLFNRVREVPAARKKVNEFRTLKARLELQAREIKENLMTAEESVSVDAFPVLPEPVSIERSELEGSLPVKAALFGIRDGLRTFIKEAIKAIGMHRFDPGSTEIIVTGGGAYMPSVVECIREALATLGPAYPTKVRADYVSPLYTSIPNIGSLFPLLAVSLGCTEKEYPEDQTVGQAAAAAASGTTHAKQAAQSRFKAPMQETNKLRLT